METEQDLKRGYSISRFVSPSTVEEYNLTCPICLQVPADPRAGPCEHVACNECLEEWVNKQQNCPVCREPVELSDLKRPLGRIARMLYGNLQIKCNNEGCDAAVKVFDLQSHMSVCPKAIIKCPNPGCNFSALREDFSSHECACVKSSSPIPSPVMFASVCKPAVSISREESSNRNSGTYTAGTQSIQNRPIMLPPRRPFNARDEAQLSFGRPSVNSARTTSNVSDSTTHPPSHQVPNSKSSPNFTSSYRENEPRQQRGSFTSNANLLLQGSFNANLSFQAANRQASSCITQTPREQEGTSQGSSFPIGAGARKATSPMRMEQESYVGTPNRGQLNHFTVPHQNTRNDNDPVSPSSNSLPAFPQYTGSMHLPKNSPRSPSPSRTMPVPRPSSPSRMPGSPTFPIGTSSVYGSNQGWQHQQPMFAKPYAQHHRQTSPLRHR